MEEIKNFPTSLIAAADYNIREDRCEMPSVMSEGDLAVFECERNSSGIIHLDYIAPRDARIIIAFDEHYTDGRFPNRMNVSNAVEMTREGDISFENFKKYENEYSLLEYLPKWNFVEWSKANDWCEGVNFPTNMLYAAALEAVYRLYGDNDLMEKAEKIRNTVRETSFDGKFFHDQALRTDGRLAMNEHISETCQYYALYFGTADTDKYSELKRTLLTEFGPNSEKYPEIEKANAFMGICLRMDLLLVWKKRDMLIDDNV